VVSDFSLIDAIESGIVKVPRVPVADDSMTGDQPVYRDLWVHVREHLPKKGRNAETFGDEPKPPKELAGALYSLYGNYDKYYRQWEAAAAANDGSACLTPPVFIVVCSNTSVSKMVFDWIAGWEKPLPTGETVLVPGKLDIFSNVEPGGAGQGRWISRPNTILVDSSQLESGETMTPEFKKIAAVEIEEFKNEYRERFPGRDIDSLTDEDLLREVMNTIGKPGKLGEQIKCVVSVSMLTEGWDASTVSHILGVRAFSTQLLCEQVVGRGLRRTSYTPDERGMLTPEYAEVYGVPFSFIPCSGAQQDPKPGPIPTRVRALEDRAACEIAFPRLLGYRWELPNERLHATFTAASQLPLSTELLPTRTENWPIVGERSVHTLDDLKTHRLQEVAFSLAKRTLEGYFRDDEGADKPWLLPQLLHIARDWLDGCVTCKDNCFKQMLLLEELAHDAADRIYGAIVRGEEGEKRLKPILRPYDTLGSTRYVDFDTTRPVYLTNPEKCHISHVVADTESWEQKMAQVLEDMPEVVSYAKNQNLGFWIPYTLNGEERNYQPDFIVRLRVGAGETSGRASGAEAPADGDLLNLIVEVSGEPRRDKIAKTTTARDLWVPAVNNHGGFGRWGFLEITDP
jgi:type III restriction enzyme